ncbi:class I SAM-dependent methyltransferase [Deinococcus actinosclerus]|uniref:Methyltransferase type 11 n=1 Tax=Deinococcus actinosclerus TaxID=1768108 RepID=A0ABM5X519_9DEIO|nr:class I SAM-dependent methyltransferase [Deinococcus actinosclerus]ALW88791.1 methyltransferase type 11 [Deinococcus actinosclerus]
MTLPPTDHPARFLGRADAYAAARPGYPAALGAWLEETGLLSAGVADIGAGTGRFTALLLAGGARVAAVEPNPEMRAHLEASLDGAVRAGQLSVHAGTSEATGLPGGSAGLITAAQAAHWFDPARTVPEFRRVLRPGGLVLLVWNDWRAAETPFSRAYGEVVRAHTGDDPLRVRVLEDELPQHLPGGFERHIFTHDHPLTREGLRALATSVSYLPNQGDPAYPAIARALDAAFAAHERDGQVALAYQTQAFLGRLD